VLQERNRKRAEKAEMVSETAGKVVRRWFEEGDEGREGCMLLDKE
jgi:hypothetical protein